MTCPTCCPECGELMEPTIIWKRSSAKLYCGVPGSASCVKETITYYHKYQCMLCKHTEFVEEFPEFENDPDLEEMM